MNHCTKLGWLAIGALALGLNFWFVPAQAAPPITNINLNQAGWSLGFGFLGAGFPYQGASSWNRFIPLFNYSTPGFYIHGLSIGWHLDESGPLHVDVVAEPETLHYNAGFSPRFHGLSTRLASAMGGLALVYRRGFLGIRASALTDLLSRSDGQKIRAMLFAHMVSAGWFFDPRAGVEWESASFVDYYFGIPGYEASPLHPAYAPGSTLNTLLEFLVGRQLGSHFTAMGGLEEEFYGAGIRASPLVNRSSSLSYVVGLYFRFR